MDSLSSTQAQTYDHGVDISADVDEIYAEGPELTKLPN
jgi:hypothetical protein